MTMQLGLEHFFERYSRLEAVNSAQIKFIAQKYLKEDNFFVQVLK
jgi:hypothetical protein